MSRVDTVPIDPAWMTTARHAALPLRALTQGTRGAGHSVYVVLLRDRGFPACHGLYVGQTSRDPDWRFDQHKSGCKASGAVKRFGVRLLPDLVEHLNPLQRWESLEIEAALAEAFRHAGVGWIEGGHWLSGGATPLPVSMIASAPHLLRHARRPQPPGPDRRGGHRAR